MERFKTLGVIKNEAKFNEESLRKFNYDIKNLVKKEIGKKRF